MSETYSERSSSAKIGAAIRSSFAVRALLFLFFFLFWGLRYGEYLYVVRNYSFFPLFFSEFGSVLAEPGGGLELFALLFAETFENVFLGAFCLSALSLAIVEFAFSLWRSHGEPSTARYCLALAVGFIANAIFIGAGLNVFESNHGTFFLEPILGVFLVLSAVRATRAIERPGRRFAAAILTVFAGFPLFGVCAFVFAVVFSLDEIARSVDVRKKFAPTSRLLVSLTALVLFAALTPIAWRLIAWGKYDLTRLYRAALIEETTVSLDPTTIALEKILFILLFAALAFGGVFATTARVREAKAQSVSKRANKSSKRKTDKKSKNANAGDLQNGLETQDQRSRDPKAGRYDSVRAEIAVAALLALGLVFVSPHDDIFMTAVACFRPLQAEDCERIVELESRVREPSDSLIMLRHMALFYEGEIGERLFERPNVAKETPLLTLVNPYRTFGAKVMDMWGVSNMSSRTATNNYVATLGRSVPANQTLASTGYDRRENNYSERFLIRLNHSLAISDRRWKNVAAQYRDVSHWDEFWIMPTEDYIETGLASPERIVAGAIARRSDLARFNEYQVERTRMWEVRLCYALLDGDFDTFETELPSYWHKAHVFPLPKSFQESALFLERVHQFPVEEYKIDPEVRKRFDEFTKYVDFYQKTRDPKLLEGIRSEFGNTAWFYFIFQRTEEGSDYGN